MGLLFLAALAWGVGNAFTGLTAGKYSEIDSLGPPLLIAIANTLGGLLFLIASFVILRAFHGGDTHPARFFRLTAQGLGKAGLVAGVSKALNTAMYVLSATYVSATAALVLESTYVLFTTLFAFVATQPLRDVRWIVRSALLVLAASLTLGYSDIPDGGSRPIGILAGLGAAASYAVFVLAWASATARIDGLERKVMATGVLLLCSLCTLAAVLLGTVVSGRSSLVAGAGITAEDFMLQLLNGILVVGVVYLLVTIGLARIECRRNSAVLGASVLTLSIPFTLLTEAAGGRVVPTELQGVGIILFLVSLVSLRGHGSRQGSGAPS